MKSKNTITAMISQSVYFLSKLLIISGSLQIKNVLQVEII